MKMRIATILLAGVVILLGVEILRYRSANKNFKALYEIEASRKRAIEHTLFPLNEALEKLLQSDANEDGAIEFKRIDLSYTFYTDSPRETEPAAFIDFAIKESVDDSQRKEIGLIIQEFSEEYDRIAKGVWRISHEFTSDELNVFMFANFPINDERLEKFE